MSAGTFRPAAGPVVRLPDGRPICGACAALCPAEGHHWRPSGGWWCCACAGSLPGHDAVTDPADPAGCAMAWRECRRCALIDERPIAELHRDHEHDEGDELEHRPGGHLRQDVPTGPVLPNQVTASEHVSSEENAMVRLDESTGRLLAVPVAVDVVSPGKGLVTSGAGDFSGSILRHNRDRGGNGSGYLVETEWGEVIGRAGSYRAGAARLARHHGFTADPVEVEFEADLWGTR